MEGPDSSVYMKENYRAIPKKMECGDGGSVPSFKWNITEQCIVANSYTHRRNKINHVLHCNTILEHVYIL